jgi:ABC-2 type transport system permease protein
MRQIARLAILLARSYLRDRTAVFFSFFVPFLFMVIFGYLNLGGFSRVSVGVIDHAANSDSARFLGALRQVTTLAVSVVDEETALRRLHRSELDLALVLPADLRLAPARAGAAVPTVQVLENVAAPQNVAVGRAIVVEIIDRISFAASDTAPVVRLEVQEVRGVRLRYVDFLVPGILGLNVMQLNVLSVANALVTQRQRGVLRRIFATPVDPRRYLIALGATRLVLSTAQVLILVAVAVVLFQLRIVGGMADLLITAVVGAVPFLMLGLAVAGWAKTENQVPALGNLVTLPQFFLSGVFFPKEAAPEVVRPLTNWLPLTLLNDALREIATQGASLWDERVQIAGLVAWAIVFFALAVRLLRLRED